MQPLSSNRPLLKASIIVTILALSFWIASYFPELVFALILSCLAAFILHPLVKFVELRLGLKRIFSVLGVFVVVGGIVIFTLANLFPLILSRIQGFYNQFKTFPFEAKLTESAQKLLAGFSFISPSDLSKQIHSLIESGVQQIGSVLENALGAVVSLAIVPIVTFFILVDGNRGVKKLIERVPNKYFEMTLNVIHKINRDLVGYLRGWLMEALIVGLLSYVGYTIIGIDYAILIGLIAGIANMIPYLGPVVGAVPALLVSLTQYGDFRMLVPIVIVAVAVQLIDEMIVQPFTFAKAIDMHPLSVIVVLLIGNELLGIAGMLLAIPLFTILKVAAKETYWGLKRYRITS